MSGSVRVGGVRMAATLLAVVVLACALGAVHGAGFTTHNLAVKIVCS
jgi:hypothetical protein